MTDYFYMFSSGEYSDYTVGGLYSSKEKLGEEYFAKYLKTHMISQVPEAKEFFDQLETDIYALTGYNLPENLYKYCTQDELPSVVMHVWSYGSPGYIEYNEKVTAYLKRKQAWLEEKQFTQDIVALLVKEGTIKEIEYEEIHNG